MRTVQHVFRRGGVYWWRRRIAKISSERFRQPIAVSLKTRELATARRLAAHLTLASEQIIGQEASNMLSKQQVKSLLTVAVSDHLHKLSRIAAMELADGFSAADGRRLDLLTGWALRLKAPATMRPFLRADSRKRIFPTSTKRSSHFVGRG